MKSISKYIKRKNPANKKRLIFRVMLGAATCIIVEDIISAIIVNKATSFDTIAILNNSIGDDIIVTLKQYSKIIVWLDYDVRISAIKQTKRLNTLGFNVTCKITRRDPKQYDQQEIKETLL